MEAESGKVIACALQKVPRQGECREKRNYLSEVRREAALEGAEGVPPERM